MINGYNVGDKVICKKDFIENNKKYFNKGDILYIMSIDMRFLCNSKEEIHIRVNNEYLKYGIQIDLEEFSEYFLTIGELREDRINSILND